jgi:hypothetical protein
MKLPDVVQSAATAKIQAEWKPVSDKLSRLRAVIDAYEALAKQDVERRVSNSLLAALGMPEVPADQTFETAAKDLREALLPVAELINLPFLVMTEVPVREVTLPPSPAATTEPAPPPPETEVSPASEPEPPSVSGPTLTEALATLPATAAQPTPPAAAAPPVKIPRKLRQEDIAHAKRLITEVTELRGTVRQHHPVRLSPLIQAIVAEVRFLLNRLPEDNHLHERLGDLIPVLGALRSEGGVDDFIKGLAFHHDADWERLAFKNRRRVADYDRDAEQGPPSGRDHKPKKSEETNGHTNGNGNGNGHAHQWPSLPHLRSLPKTILLAGGILVPEKLKSIHERFGLDVEWHEIDHDNPRASQTLLQRVRAGKVGAVIFLEGVMRHTTWKPVSEACTQMGVPYAMADKAGTASLQTAFADLERQLGA